MSERCQHYMDGSCASCGKSSSLIECEDRMDLTSLRAELEQARAERDQLRGVVHRIADAVGETAIVDGKEVVSDHDTIVHVVEGLMADAMARLERIEAALSTPPEPAQPATSAAERVVSVGRLEEMAARWRGVGRGIEDDGRAVQAETWFEHADELEALVKEVGGG